MDVADSKSPQFPFSIDSFKNMTHWAGTVAWGLLHELGHSMQRAWWSKKFISNISFRSLNIFSLAFDGTGEVTTNIFVLYVLDIIYHIRSGIYEWKSQQISEARTYLQNGAQFTEWKKMPLLALTIYIQLVREFGWDSYKAVFRHYENTKPNLLNDQQKMDYWITTFSQHVKKNLVPLFKFWGFPVSSSTMNILAILTPAVISDEIIQIDPARYKSYIPSK